MNNLLHIFIYILSFFLSINYAYSMVNMQDNLVETTLKKNNIEQPVTNTNYNYENLEAVAIKLKIQNKITSKKDIQDGDIITFIVKDDVFYDNKIIVNRGTVINAKIKAVLKRGLGGIPGQIVIDDFEIPNIDSRKLKSHYIKRGRNTTLLILPLKWALTPIPFVGSFTNLILGGHAKISPDDNITIFYYPNWHLK